MTETNKEDNVISMLSGFTGDITTVRDYNQHASPFCNTLTFSYGTPEQLQFQ